MNMFSARQGGQEAAHGIVEERHQIVGFRRAADGEGRATAGIFARSAIQRDGASCW